MKKNDVLLFISALLFSGLFYKQAPGINFLLFTLLVSATILIFHPEKIKDKRWWYYCICCNLAGTAVFVINSDLSLLACIFSLLILSSESVNRENSILMCFFFGIYSLLSSFVHWVIEQADKRSEADRSQRKNSWKLIGSVAISFLAVIVFFNLYKLSNPLFREFTKYIHFDWFSFGWLCFTCFGVLVMFGLLRSRRVNEIAELEISLKTDLREAEHAPGNNSQNTSIAAFILFLMLNVMLLFMNGLDIANLYITQKLPAGITLSDFVHEAVRSTVLSIVIAVSLIAWFFRGDLNFSQSGRKIKFLVYLWVLQSLVVVLNTMIRNYWYIQEYQLSHLRIGVFAFLLLCFFGLILTYFKISKRRSSWGLAIRNANVWFAMLILVSLFNWDRLITNYNIQHATGTKALDKAYLISLSDANLPELVQLYKTVPFTEYEKRILEDKIERSYKKDRFRQWQSFNLRSYKNQEVIRSLPVK